MREHPSDLLSLQRWFAGIVTTPMEREMSADFQEECAQILTDSPTLKSHERIAIYNRLYWYRLLGLLQKGFPFLLRLFGDQDFNEKIAIPYLTKYPPSDWRLSTLGDLLPHWLEETYHRKDRELILSAAAIDLAHEKLFLAEAKPQLKDLTKKITLQPFVDTLMMQGDLLALRNIFLEHSVEYWQENPFPGKREQKIYYYILFRDSGGVIVYEEICAARYHLLSEIKKGTGLEEICGSLSGREEEFEGIATWFQEWTLRGWLA